MICKFGIVSILRANVFQLSEIKIIFLLFTERLEYLAHVLVESFSLTLFWSLSPFTSQTPVRSGCKFSPKLFSN